MVYIRSLRLTGISAIAKITAYEGNITFCKEHESCRIISKYKTTKTCYKARQSAKCSYNTPACITAYICSQYTRFSSKIQTKVVTLYMVILINPLAYTDVPETAGLARSINTQPAVRRNSETNPTSRHNRGMY